MQFDLTFSAIIEAIAKLFVLMAAGYVIYLKKIVNDEFVDMLSMTIVRVIFPALIISRTISNFSFTEYSDWWFFPAASIILALAGFMLAGLLRGVFRVENDSREMRAASAFHNCGYLPMNLIVFTFAGMVAERLLIYVFLYILGFNLLMWSLVPLYLKGHLRKDFKWKVFLNPPVVATLFSLLWVAFIGKGTLPEIIASPMAQLGNASFPLVMLTLGAYLCRYRAFRPENPKALSVAIAVRLLVIPALVLGALYFMNLSFDKEFFLFLQSTMPTAVSLVIIGSYTDANNRLLSGTIFYTHVLGLFTIPLWMGLFSLLER